MKILAFGDAELMDGFALLGIETHADPDVDTVESILSGMVRDGERALVYIQQDLMLADIPIVSQLRLQGGTILVCEIPNLHAVDDYRPQVEKLIGRVFGASMQERRVDD